MKAKSFILAVLATSAISSHALADWQLNNDESSVAFISTKNVNASEQHSFSMLAGTLSSSGELNVKVSLDTVETNIAIRNDRMKEHLFDVAEHPVATLTASVPNSILKMSSGESQKATLDSKITISGQAANYAIDVIVFKQKDGSFVAATRNPVMIDANKHGLQDGISKLTELAGLQNISLTVPVTFSVLFN